jgi:hypothetical protein
MGNIHKFEDFVNEGAQSGEMIPIKTNKYGDKYVDAVVSFNVTGYLRNDDDDRTEVTIEEALNIVKGQLYELAGSNDGSEVLANIPKKDITFKK